jgi:ribosomal protein L40E
MFLVDMVRRLISQVRVCPSCGHRQPKQTHEDKRRDRCEKCGAALPTDRGTGTTGRG